MKGILTLLMMAQFSSWTATAQAQIKAGKITGDIEDESKAVVEAATISLLKTKGSSVIKIAAADKLGKYHFENIDNGKYIVAATAIGYGKVYSPAFEISASTSTVQLKTIELLHKANAMTGVVVTAKRPLIEQKADRTIINVDASPTNAGATAITLMIRLANYKNRFFDFGT